MVRRWTDFRFLAVRLNIKPFTFRRIFVFVFSPHSKPAMGKDKSEKKEKKDKKQKEVKEDTKVNEDVDMVDAAEVPVSSPLYSGLLDLHLDWCSGLILGSD